MPSPFDASGYTDLRTYIRETWTHVALVDDTGTEVTRIDVAADSRASWSSPSADPLTATITIRGDDSDIALPVTLARSESCKSSTASTRMAADSFTDASIEAPADELTVTHQIEIQPQ